MFLDTKKVLIKSDLQRTYMWELILPDISEVSNIDVSAYVQKVRFGSYNFTDLITRKEGPFTTSSAGTLDIGPMEITILSPVDNLVVKYFQDWKDKIIDPSGFYYPKVNYAKSAYIYLYDTAGNQTDSYRLINIFPKTFPSYGLDYGDTNVVKFDISFNIDRILPT
jgi:hypothetical protein